VCHGSKTRDGENYRFRSVFSARIFGAGAPSSRLVRIRCEIRRDFFWVWAPPRPPRQWQGPWVRPGGRLIFLALQHAGALGKKYAQHTPQAHCVTGDHYLLTQRYAPREHYHVHPTVELVRLLGQPLHILPFPVSEAP
jgi:hypothetical protein